MPTRTTALLASLCTLVLGALTARAAPAEVPGVPRGWMRNGPAHYAVSTLPGGGPRGANVLQVRGLPPAGEREGDFGGLMQRVSAERYVGRRVRLSASVRSEGLRGWAGLWMRVDGQRPREILGFDNMQDRPVRGTTPWTRYEVVLDIPQGAQALAFGILCAGEGEVAVHDVSLEEVPTTVPVTNLRTTPALTAPTNLDFSR